MSAKHDKPEERKCHHCGHEWEPRVKNPKKCPTCQNPLWRSPNPKKRKVSTAPIDVVAEPTPTAPSEAAVPTPPTTDTNTAESDAAGADVPVETPIQRARREADERLRRLADAPID